MPAAAYRREPGGATLAQIGRTLRAIAHLRADQIAWRILLTLRRARWERRSAAVDARYRARASRAGPARWSHPGLAAVASFRAGLRDEDASLAAARDALEGRFTFLGRSDDMGREVAWFRPDLDVGTRLWKTQLHEFPYAEDLARAARESGDGRYRARLFELARSWRAAAPIGCRGFALDAWNGRATATRLVHWAVAGAQLGLVPGDPDADWLSRQIAQHALFLRDNLERDLRGNHLLRDWVGLAFARELVGLPSDALAGLAGQVAEQVLPDGCHVERAPMYHALCLADLLEVRLLLGEGAPDWLRDAVARMAGLLEALLLGDGEIPLLGDGWLGEVDSRALLAAARRAEAPRAPRDPERHGGLVPLRAGDWRAVVRAGPHGPDWQLGHAHADLLSLDLSFGSHRVVTDTGTHHYDADAERLRLRSTAAHNTLRLDGVEQLEVWDSFRAGRRGRAHCATRGGDGVWDWISAYHDAYSHLPGRPIHHRLVALHPDGAVALDAVLGSGRHRIESHWNEHPDCPPDVAGSALGAPARSRQVPLHQHHGHTREMTQQVIEVEADLPWVGGWVLWREGGEFAPRGGGLAAELRAREGLVTLRTGGLRLAWRPGQTRPEAALELSLCSRARGSAN